MEYALYTFVSGIVLCGVLAVLVCLGGYKDKGE